jgi:signal transduction histidine kinase
VAAGGVGGLLRRLGATSQKWSEGSLHERADPTTGPPEVREVATALNAMAARLDTLVHASRAVVADVSHQLRTPLAAMRLRLELAREELTGTAGAAADEDIAVSLTEIERLSRLVDGLLTVARAESTDTVSVPIDVAAVIRDRMQAWQPVASEQRVTINADVPTTPTIASATPGHLEQILDNVLDNALEAVSEAGAIDMVVRREDERIRVDIRDNGIGMSDQLRDQAFRRFASGRDGTGSGLGLAVVHRLVTADGGSVEIDSQPGRGTVVSVWLPAARRDPSHQPDAAIDHLDRQSG